MQVVALPGRLAIARRFRSLPRLTKVQDRFAAARGPAFDRVFPLGAWTAGGARRPSPIRSAGNFIEAPEERPRPLAA